MQEENWRKVKPAEANDDWKPNACTAMGPGINPELTGAKQGNSAVLTHFPPPNFVIML